MTQDAEILTRLAALEDRLAALIAALGQRGALEEDDLVALRLHATPHSSTETAR